MDKAKYHKLLKHCRKRFGALKDSRTSWESHWYDLARHFLPRKSRFLEDTPNDGRKKSTNIFDNVGIVSAGTLASGMQSGLTSPSRPWFRLTLQNADLARQDEAKYWLHDTQERMNNAYSYSNLYGQLALFYHELGVFGTAVLLVEEDEKSILRCRALTAGEYWLDSDRSGRVDTLYYVQEMTARQLVDAWPDTVPERINNMADNDNSAYHKVICAIEPRKEFDRFSKRGGDRPWAAVYYLEGGGEDGILEVSGFYEFPALAARWDVTGADVYGRGPGMDALANCRTIQKMREDGLTALSREVRPPLMVPSNLFGGGLGVDLSPDGINPYTPNSAQQNASPVMPLYQVRSNLEGLEMTLNYDRGQVKDSFMVNLFLLLTNADKNMTATEVAERNSEKMLILGPTLDRLRSELFQPLIERSFGIMLRSGHIMQPPPSIQGAELKIEFISLLAQAQQEAGIATNLRLMQITGEVVAITQSAEVLDIIDFDALVRNSGERMGADPSIIRSDEDVAAIRQARAEAAQAAQQQAEMVQSIEMTKGLAQASKDMDQSQAAGAEAQYAQ